MKILLVNKYHYLRGGAERAYFDTAAILEEAGHETAFFSMRHPQNRSTPWERYFVDQVEYDDDGRSFWTKLSMAARILWNFEAQRKLDRLISDFRPDVAHLHNIYHQLSPSILWTLKRRGVPVVMTLHDYKLVSPNYNLFSEGRIWEESRPGKYYRCVADRCVKGSFLKSLVCAVEAYLHRFLDSYGQADVFLSPSRFLAGKFREFGWKHPIEYVPQPLLPFPDSVPGWTETSSSDAPFVFVGRLSEEKGVDRAIEAMRHYRGKSSLLIIGSGPDESRLRALAKSLGVEGRTDFLGAKYGEERERIVRLAKAVVIPSLWYENMPYVLLEALGAGRPVVASRLGGMAERIKEGVNGFLVDPGDAHAIAGGMEKVDDLVRKNDTDLFRFICDLDPGSYRKKLESIYADLAARTGNPAFRHK
jgi:glycosyltransferase involved in cell wall biosynthesis